MNAVWIAFAGEKRVARGSPGDVVSAVKQARDANSVDEALMFDADTGKTIEVDLRGSLTAVLGRLPIGQQSGAGASEAPVESPRRPGRPRLGVVSREVTLLPRHWDWLAAQPGGASVALRKLVDQARRDNKEVDRKRRAREAAYRFMHVMAGDRAGFEEAARALFADDLDRLQECVAKWPRDIRRETLAFAQKVFAEGEKNEN